MQSVQCAGFRGCTSEAARQCNKAGLDRPASHLSTDDPARRRAAWKAVVCKGHACLVRPELLGLHRGPLVGFPFLSVPEREVNGSSIHCGAAWLALPQDDAVS